MLEIKEQEQSLREQYPQATDTEIKQILRIRSERSVEVSKVEAYKRTHLCEFLKLWKWQKRAISLIPDCNILIIPAPNKIGKTVLLVNLADSIAKGYCSWTQSNTEREGYIHNEGFWYEPAPFHKRPPVRIRITGESWITHIGETIVYEFEKYAIRGSYTTKKNNEGVVCLITYANGSTIQLMTYGSRIDDYESWTGDLWMPDEPPPLDIFEATARGLNPTQGKIFMFMTPLKEAWILNKLIQPENKRYDVAVIDNLTFLDNEDLVNEDTALLKSGGALEGDIDEYFRLLLAYENLSKGQHIALINAHLKRIVDEYMFVEIMIKLKGLKRINDTEEENRDARFKGMFRHLVGRIYKNYKDFYFPNGNLVKPFKIETDWPVIPQIDFHMAEYMVVNFYAVDKMDRLYVIYEIFERLSANDISHELIRLKNKNSWRIEKAFIDPLSKGDDKSMINRLGPVDSSYTILKRLLNTKEIILETGSKDKRSGIDNIRERLSPSGGIPTIFVFDTCIHHRRQFKQWGYTKEGKWCDEDDHCMETLGRATLTGIKYSDPNEYKKYKFIPDKGVV